MAESRPKIGGGARSLRVLEAHPTRFGVNIVEPRAKHGRVVVIWRMEVLRVFFFFFLSDESKFVVGDLLRGEEIV